MFIPKLNSKCVFKYHFDGGKKLCRWQNVLKETKLHSFVCLATADSISISVSPTKGSLFITKKNNLKQHKQSLKQHKTARRYRSTLVNNLELKTCENNINIFSNILILCGNL